jgi:hypothetical protein
VIESAEEFVRLRQSADAEDQRRASQETAPVEIWRDVIERFPDMKTWVAHNKTVPLEILELLRRDDDERVVWTVKRKRAWARAHPEDSGRGGQPTNTRSAAWKQGQFTKEV